MAEFKYEIVKKLGILSENPRGWTKELNLIRWNERDPKFDLREWGPNHEKMGKGITLSQEELENLLTLLQELVEAEGMDE